MPCQLDFKLLRSTLLDELEPDEEEEDEEAQDGAAGDDTKPKPKIKKTNPKPKKTPKPKSTTTSKKREQEGGQDTEPVTKKQVLSQNILDKLAALTKCQDSNTDGGDK